MKGAKKDKKNGKDSGGGVVAAVTKHAAGKFTLVCPLLLAGPHLWNAPRRTVLPVLSCLLTHCK